MKEFHIDTNMKSRKMHGINNWLSNYTFNCHNEKQQLLYIFYNTYYDINYVVRSYAFLKKPVLHFRNIVQSRTIHVFPQNLPQKSCPILFFPAPCQKASIFHLEENRIPKALFYGEMVGGQRSRGGQHKRYKDVLKYNLKACDIPIETWERQALNRPEWCTACRVGVERFECRRIEQLQETRIARHVCPDCQRHCRSSIGLISHRKKHATLLN